MKRGAQKPSPTLPNPTNWTDELQSITAAALQQADGLVDDLVKVALAQAHAAALSGWEQVQVFFGEFEGFVTMPTPLQRRAIDGVAVRLRALGLDPRHPHDDPDQLQLTWKKNR